MVAQTSSAILICSKIKMAVYKKCAKESNTVGG